MGSQIDAGAKVTDIGMAGTEEVYFATKHLLRRIPTVK